MSATTQPRSLFSLESAPTAQPRPLALSCSPCAIRSSSLAHVRPPGPELGCARSTPPAHHRTSARSPRRSRSFLYAILLVYYRPYSSAADNVLALLSQLALYVSMLQSILVKSATGEIPTDVTAILIVCAVTPSVLLIAVSVQIVFNELQVDPVGQVAEKAKTRVSQVGARLSTRRASSHASSHASSTALNHTDGWKWNRVQAPALDAAGLPIAPPGSRKLGTVVV